MSFWYDNWILLGFFIEIIGDRERFLFYKFVIKIYVLEVILNNSWWLLLVIVFFFSYIYINIIL